MADLVKQALTQFTPATNNVAPENAVERLGALLPANQLPHTSALPTRFFAIFVILLAMGMFPVTVHCVLYGRLLVANSSVSFLILNRETASGSWHA